MLQLELRAPSEALIGQWDSLAERQLAPPFLRAGWILAWTRAFGRGQLRLLCAQRDEELVGVVPFLEQRGVRRSPANWHTPLFGWIASGDEVNLALAQSLLGGARTRTDLAFLDRADPGLDALERAAHAHRQPVITRTIMRSPYVKLEGDWESYRSSLPRKTRKEAERLHRRLQEEGRLVIEFVKDLVDVEAQLEEGFKLEGSGWKEQQRSAIISDPRTHAFYSEVARWAHSRQQLLLAFLRLDNRAIAFDLCLESAGVTYVLKGGFDPDYRRFGPGMLLTYESLRRGFEEGLACYELLGDDDGYKLMWTQTVRDRVRFQAFGRSPTGIVSRLAWSHGRNAARGAVGLAQRHRAGNRLGR